MGAKRKAELDQNLQLQIAELVDTLAGNYAARKAGKPTRWMFPVSTGEAGEWNGDLFDLGKIEERFNRKGSSEDFKDSLKDPENPGVVADLEVSQLQAEYLACMERAFRNRHATVPRMIAHASARQQGHGSPTGVFNQALVGWLSNIIKKASSEA